MDDPSEGRRVCILGATSAIAEHTARRLAADKASLALIGRDGRRLEALAGDLTGRGARQVVTKTCDLAALDDPGGLLDTIAAALGGLDTVMIFHGVLGDQAFAERNPDEAARSLNVNFMSAAALSLAAAERLERSEAARPVLLCVGSVAGDRGRASNYVYGAAKGGLAILYQGLQHRFARRSSRARAVLIKAGFVDTPMTAAFPKGGPLWAKPETIAMIIVASLARGGPIVYAPWIWRWIMLIIRLMPQSVMNRINL